MPLGIYISVPFCRSKCSYCNFASGVFSRELFRRYVDRVTEDISRARILANESDAGSEAAVDAIYLGGGTPTVLAAEDMERMFAAIRAQFDLLPGSEITVECAPGTLDAAILDALLVCGVNRISFGAQSFSDEEGRAVGRLHTRAVVLDDIARVRGAGIANINVDLIAGLPHQTEKSWRDSLEQLVRTGVPHASVYMLEVDDDSRLGRELIAGGTRYHATFVPDEDLTSRFYEIACDELEAAGMAQYEISNFSWPGFESRHNLKYWTRQPYLGFGVDAHSMLRCADGKAVRFATSDSLEDYLAAKGGTTTAVTRDNALEESFFLGLRLNRGVDLGAIEAEFGEAALERVRPAVSESIADGLLAKHGSVLHLTPRGRLLSNEVFARFLGVRASCR